MASKRMPHPMAVERSVEDERLRRRQRLALAFRIFGRLGFDEGVAGHITARDPGREDHFWVNPFGMSFKQITADDLLLVDHHGAVVEGDWPVNQAAFAIHSGIHAARPDVVAAAHSHSKFGRAWSTLGRPLSPITQDSCIFHDDHVVFDDYTGVVNDPEEGKRIAHALGGRKAAILRNHGILTVGQSIEETVFWYVTMERSCEVELLARAAGDPQLIADDVARQTAGYVGNHMAGWFSGQPLFDWIAEEEPDAYGDAAPVA
ncbi:MAG: Ribulose-5-phosphate 4-epimerase and related epimerase and aldolase [Acidimicrobiales bacterium]|nr:Ribulose-5-phosphate 4-epimerase and related epimerase and aldolase [Acidimicrobiales bacterium]